MTATEAVQCSLDDKAAERKPATHTIYTPKWEPEWDDETGEITAGKFYDWLAVGKAWQEDGGGTVKIHSLPTNQEETATSFFVLVPVGAPPPTPLTITRDEYLDQQFGSLKNR